MGFFGILMQVTRWVGVIILSELAAAAISFPIALPNCPDRCGDVEIPYPFGLREGCYIDPNFYINCTSNSFGKTQPILPENITVTSISLEGQTEILMFIAKDCYEQGVLDPIIWNRVWLYSPLNFSVSNTQNKFVAVGCDTLAFLKGSRQNVSYTTGCISVCGSTSNMVNGFCSGVGCCEVDIPLGLKQVIVQFNSFDNHTEVRNFNPCGYAFISKQDTFNFSIASLLNLRDETMMPMVLDWAIGTETCEDVANKSSYTCGGNSSCINSNNKSGYLCKCMHGYGLPWEPIPP